MNYFYFSADNILGKYPVGVYNLLGCRQCKHFQNLCGTMWASSPTTINLIFVGGDAHIAPYKTFRRKMMKQEQYNISGMSCAACSSSVQRVVSKLTGVESCEVNLITGKMTVNYDETKTGDLGFTPSV